MLAELRGASKRFGTGAAAVDVVRDVDLTVRSGELLAVAVLGPNGAGKTTSISMLTGLTRPTAGTSTLFGRDPRGLDARRRIGVMLQASGVPETLRVRELDRERAEAPSRSVDQDPLSAPDVPLAQELEGPASPVGDGRSLLVAQDRGHRRDRPGLGVLAQADVLRMGSQANASCREDPVALPERPDVLAYRIDVTGELLPEHGLSWSADAERQPLDIASAQAVGGLAGEPDRPPVRGVEDDIGRNEAPPVPGDLGALAGEAHERRAHPDPDPPADERRRHRAARCAAFSAFSLVNSARPPDFR